MKFLAKDINLQNICGRSKAIYKNVHSHFYATFITVLKNKISNTNLVLKLKFSRKCSSDCYYYFEFVYWLVALQFIVCLFNLSYLCYKSQIIVIYFFLFLVKLFVLIDCLYYWYIKEMFNLSMVKKETKFNYWRWWILFITFFVKKSSWFSFFKNELLFSCCI